MSHTFEFDGEKYKKASRHQKEWGSSLIGELSLRGDEKILEIMTWYLIQFNAA